MDISIALTNNQGSMSLVADSVTLDGDGRLKLTKSGSDIAMFNFGQWAYYVVSPSREIDTEPQ